LEISLDTTPRKKIHRRYSPAQCSNIQSENMTKSALTHTPDPIRPTKWGGDHNRPTLTEGYLLGILRDISRGYVRAPLILLHSQDVNITRRRRRQQRNGPKYNVAEIHLCMTDIVRSSNTANQRVSCLPFTLSFSASIVCYLINNNNKQR